MKEEQQKLEQPHTPKENLFIVPYQRNMHFMGREKMLAAVHDGLFQSSPKRWNHRVALHGLGGVGKTQVALEFAYSRRGEYDNVYWITAVSQMTLFSGFQEIARQTHCVVECAKSKPSDVTVGVLTWMNRKSKWLLILDNLDDLSVIDGYLAGLSTGHILITTRDQHYYQIPAEGIETGPLEIEEAIELLLIRSSVVSNSMARRDEGIRSIESVAKDIVQELGLLPLAIEQAAGYIREASSDIFKYLSSYRQNRKAHHARISKGNRNFYSKSVAATWRLSFQTIESRNPDASKLLHLIAFLNSDGILLEFLEAGAAGLDDELREIVSDRDRLYEALAELQRFSLIGRQGLHTDRQVITVHRLVQFVIKDEMSSEQSAHICSEVMSLCDSAFPPWHNWDTNLLHQSRLYEDQVVGPLFDVPLTSYDRMDELLIRVGLFLREDGKYQQATQVLAKALQARELKGMDQVEISKTKAMLAWSYMYQGLYSKASDLETDVMKTRQRLLGIEHPDTLESMVDLARSYRTLGQYDKAVELKRHVLDVRKKLYGDEHDDTLMSMTYLAHSYRDKGDFSTAAHLEENVLNVRMRLFDPEHPTTLQAMAHLAATYRCLGRYHEAQELQEKVLEVEIRVLGKEHPETLEVMIELGCTYRELGRLEDAIVLLERAFRGRKALASGDNPTTLWAQIHLCLAYQKLGKRNFGPDSIQKIENGLARALGKTHPWTLSATHALALSYRQNGNRLLARELFQEVVEIRKRTLGEAHPSTVDSIRERELCEQL